MVPLRKVKLEFTMLLSSDIVDEQTNARDNTAAALSAWGRVLNLAHDAGEKVLAVKLEQVKDDDDGPLQPLD